MIVDHSKERVFTYSEVKEMLVGLYSSMLKWEEESDDERDIYEFGECVNEDERLLSNLGKHNQTIAAHLNREFESK